LIPLGREGQFYGYSLLLIVSEAAAKELLEQRWTAAKLPVLNDSLFAITTYPRLRPQLVEYVISEAKVPVDRTDLSGTTTLMDLASTKRFLDLD
jgi:hypothetical protein